MENASKALIIAGAILLSILLISLGIMVYRNASGTINNANLNSEEAMAFNSRFDSYLGRRKSNADMNALVSAIQGSNGAQKGKSDTHYVDIDASDGDLADFKTGADTITGSTGGQYPSFSAGITYKATSETGDDGYINKVTINKE